MAPSPRRLPAWLIAALVLAVPAGAYAQATAGRLRVEHRAAAVASALTHRTIHVHCPGPVRRHVMYEIYDGEVRFDADGVPADATSLSATTCDGLRDVLDHGKVYDFTCLAMAACDTEQQRAARSLAILAHEIMHLRGTADEALAECLARRHVAAVAEDLGVAPQAAQRVAIWQGSSAVQQQLPERYRTDVC